MDVARTKNGWGIFCNGKMVLESSSITYICRMYTAWS